MGIAVTVVIMILKVASLKSELKGFERYSPEENLGFQEDRNQRQQPAGEYRRGDSESDELEKLGFKIYGGAGGAGGAGPPGKPDYNRGVSAMSVQTDMFRGGDDGEYRR